MKHGASISSCCSAPTAAINGSFDRIGGGGEGGRIAMAAIEWVGRWALSFDLADCFKGSLAVVE